VIKFTLIENSLDSIEQGLAFLKKAEAEECMSSYKHALLCLFQGAELVLKEVLVLIDPITIFDKNSLFKHCTSPLSPTMEELYKCKSIDIRGIAQELKKHYSGTFTKSNIKVLEKLAIDRNKVQHFAIEILPKELNEKLLELYLLVIKPAFTIIQSNNYDSDSNGISDEEITVRISKFEEAFLSIKIGEGFYIGMCPKCEELHHFIIYDGESYPTYSYCIACDYELKDLDIHNYEICPECSWPSLVYDKDNQAGVCLYEKCYYGREGGFVEMKPCNTCIGYEIEGSCSECSPEEE